MDPCYNFTEDKYLESVSWRVICRWSCSRTKPQLFCHVICCCCCNIFFLIYNRPMIIRNRRPKHEKWNVWNVKWNKKKRQDLALRNFFPSWFSSSIQFDSITCDLKAVHFERFTFVTKAWKQLLKPSTVKPEYNDHLWTPKLWPLLTGSRCLEVPLYS